MKRTIAAGRWAGLRNSFAAIAVIAAFEAA